MVVIPFLIWPLIHGDPGTHNPKKEAMIISTVFLLLTLPISIYSVANHLGKFIISIDFDPFEKYMNSICHVKNHFDPLASNIFLSQNMIMNHMKVILIHFSTKSS